MLFTQEEKVIWKLRLSFTQQISELKNDIFQFTRELQLIYHFRNNNAMVEPIVTLESTSPNSNKNSDQELEYTEISLFKTNDHLHKSRSLLGSLIAIIANKNICVFPVFQTQYITEF